MSSKPLLTGYLAAVLLTASAGGLQADPCTASPGACCPNPAACVITDKQTLAGLTIDAMVSCPFHLATYVTGGNGETGVAPAAGQMCGLSYSLTNETPASAINSLDHHWLQSGAIPKVMDFGAAVNTAIVFVAVDHGPFPEEGIEATVWGSNSPSLVGFPNGWTLATLTTIWKQGWEEPQACEPGDNADDFTGQYTFAGAGFRYVAVHANGSMSIFDDPTHNTWSFSNDSYAANGWQSDDDEIDAVGTPDCAPGSVTANAGLDQQGFVPNQICFTGSGSGGRLGWDLNGDNTIDVNGATACVPCQADGQGDVRLFVTDACGCVASDTAHYICVANRPPVCTGAAASVGELWPPNHKMASISVTGVTDADGDSVAITITDIAQDEPTNGLGDGDTCPDGSGVGSSTASVRVERSGTPKQPGNGRVYHVSFSADDGHGGHCTGQVTTCVPHDQRPGHICIDGGPLYDSTSCN